MSIWKSRSHTELKPWGKVANIKTPFGMSGKIIYLRENQRNSLKYYKRLNQALYCLSGKIIVIAPKEKEFGDFIDPEKGSTFEVMPGELILIQNENPYRLVAVEDSVLVEILMGHTADTSFMLEDDYGRV